MEHWSWSTTHPGKPISSQETDLIKNSYFVSENWYQFSKLILIKVNLSLDDLKAFFCFRFTPHLVLMVLNCKDTFKFSAVVKGVWLLIESDIIIVLVRFSAFLSWENFPLTANVFGN